MQVNRNRLISVRKLVAGDITLHGPRFILIEFGLGTPAMMLFGLWLMLSRFVFALGLYIFGRTELLGALALCSSYRQERLKRN